MKRKTASSAPPLVPVPTKAPYVCFPETRLLDNKDLDYILKTGGTNLSLWLIHTLQHGLEISEPWRQLRWRWLSNTVYWKQKRYYGRSDGFMLSMRGWREWYSALNMNQELELLHDRHLERVLYLAEFIQAYRGRDGEVPHPQLVMSAYQFRFNWAEILVQAKEDGVCIPPEKARDIALVNRYLGSHQDIDEAVRSYEEDLLNAYIEWLRNPNPRRRTAPQEPTEKVVKSFRKKVKHYLRFREFSTASFGLDELIEDEGWASAWSI